jgi:hypothetical protein
MRELSSFMGENDNQLDIKEIGEFLTSKKMDLKDIEKRYLEKKKQIF